MQRSRQPDLDGAPARRRPKEREVGRGFPPSSAQGQADLGGCFSVGGVEIADALPFHCIPDRARFHLGCAQCPQKADDFLGTLISPSLGIVDHDAGLGQGPGWLENAIKDW